MATIPNIYNPPTITTTNPGILGLKNKIKIGDQPGNMGYVAPIPRPVQQSTPVGDSLNSTGGGSYRAPQVQAPVSQPITDIPAPSRGLFNDVRSSVSSRPAQNALSFSGLVGDIRGASTPSSNQSSYLRKIERVGSENKALGQKAEDLSQKYGSEIARIGELGAGAVAGNLSTGTNVVGAGNAAIASQSASSRMNALAQGQNAELSGIEKQLAANAAERAALESALGGSQFQQSTQLGGLGTAAGFAQPQLGAVGQVPFNPLDSSQSAILGSNAQGGLQGAGALMGELEAAKQRALTGGTAQTNTFAGIYGDAQTQAAQISQQRNAINAVGNEVLGLLQNNPTMNQFALQYGNKKINQLSTQLSDPRYAALNTYIRTLQARIGSALQAGEIPTAATENANAIANGNLTLNALAATLQAVDKELGAFAQTQQDLASYAQTQFGAGQTSGGTSAGTPIGSRTTINGKQYVKVQGGWKQL